MENVSIISFYGLIFGMLGTTFGGIIGAYLNITSKKFLSFILEFAAGIMNAIICFNLIPESLKITNISLTVSGILAGIFVMIYCSKTVDKHYKINTQNNNKLFKSGIIIAIGIAIHNLPEGLAIGAGFESSDALGFNLALAIAIHDIPEGISVALPIKSGGYSKAKSIFITALSGFTTAIGAFIGALIGSISPIFIGLSLSFAAGAMLYIISCELIPESKSIYKGKFASFGNILGLILGLLSITI